MQLRTFCVSSDTCVEQRKLCLFLFLLVFLLFIAEIVSVHTSTPVLLIVIYRYQQIRMFFTDSVLLTVHHCIKPIIK